MMDVKIRKLVIEKFRGLKNLTLEFNGGINFITGRNGLGKSSILDAIKYMFDLKNSNIKYIDEKAQTEEESPIISMHLNVGNKEYFFEAFNGKYQINKIKYNATEYKKRILEIFEINDIKLLIEKIDPCNSLEKYLKSEKSEDAIKIRNLIIKIINLNNENFEVSKFDEINEKIIASKDEIKVIDSKLTDYKKEIEFLEKNNPEVNFDFELKKEFDWERHQFLKNEKQKYKECINEIEKIQNEIWELGQEKKEKLENNFQNKKNKISALDVFLVIITFGLYYFLKIKKHTYNAGNVSQVNSDLRNINKNLEKLQKQETILQNQIKNYNFNEVNDELNRMEHLKNLSKSEENNFNQNKIHHSLVKDKIRKNEELKDEKQRLKMALDERKRQIVNSFYKASANTFQNFTISLSDDSSLIIRKNGIDFKHLNYSMKKIIINEINDLLKSLISVNIFSIMDNAESINELQTKNGNQYIFCKVTNEVKLKLNGQDLN